MQQLFPLNTLSKLIHHFYRLTPVYFMPPTKSQELQPCKNYSHINRLPTEILEMIIREYVKVSVDRKRSIMNFLLVCRLWRAIGGSCPNLFTPHLVIRGRDEMEQFVTLSERKLVHPSITNLTVNLAVEYTEEPLDGACGHVRTMAQLQEDIDRLRQMVIGNWKHPVSSDDPPPHWESLKLEHFSLIVDLSAVSARKTLLKAWTRAWVSRLSREWRRMGWTGSEGNYDGGFYSYWDR